MTNLLAACDAVVAAEDLRPEYAADGTLLKTFCNIGARRVAQACGCDELDDVNLNADAMFALMDKNASGRWARLERASANAWAMGGGLCFAIMTGHQLEEQHGHVAAVRPERMKMSASAGGEVPILANVGRGDTTVNLIALRGVLFTRPNWNCRESEAFPIKRVGAPSYFAWRP